MAAEAAAADGPGRPGAPAAPARVFEHASAAQAIVAATRQQGNPILSHVRATRVEFLEGLVPDYLAGPGIAVLFISLRFQRLHPDYLKRRAEALEGRHRVRVLLCRVDLEQPEEPLEQVTLLAFHGELTLLLAFSDLEAAAYLETLHRYQNKSASAIVKRLTEGDHRTRLVEVLTSAKCVNRTDAASLAARFGSFAGIARATEEELQGCPGIGDKKLRQLRHALHAPFFPS
ncbi:unnamed protein product [Prorocentrum cordatum]|uniref:ERCC1-like central domain-containing protein n=1 Tax=Prorocentrum cordatum TaxID=2364126 RepID=A0ABN9XHE4_9DINO|nr:unnamed protein product [Polarella glacialis]